MPILASSFAPPWHWRAAHAQTIIPSFRRIAPLPYYRRRISTPDGDFLDIDCLEQGASKSAILLHGLEGDSRRPYIQGTARLLHQHGYDIFAVNFRGCSGEINRKPYFYHSGETNDLRVVLQWVRQQRPGALLALVGFSVGGNIALKYLGEEGTNAHTCIAAAVAVSVPCDLAASARKLAQPSNRLYMWSFLKTLRTKLREKQKLGYLDMDLAGIDTIRTFEEFDDRFTAPLHGFKNAADYWQHASSKYYVEGIATPALLIQSQDDPFLTPSCYPRESADTHQFLSVETTRHGGHVGFYPSDATGTTWLERRILQYLSITAQTAGA